MGIHNYDQKYAAAKRRVLKALISDHNKQLIIEMNDALVLEGQASFNEVP